MPRRGAAPAFRSASIQSVIYRNPRRPELPLEVLGIAELRRKAPAGYLARPQRPDFHQLLVPVRGHCVHEVDFQRVTLSPGTLAWIRPGQVHRFDLDSHVDGWLVLFTTDFLDARTAAELGEPIGPRIELGAAVDDVAWLVERLRRVADDLAGDLASTRWLLHHLLHALLLILRRSGSTSTASLPVASSGVFALFRAEVERRFGKTRRVQDYARRIGYSSKTLSRASQAATGLSAKAYVDRRVLLEAQRLLAHTDASIAQIASRLGFSEATNFIKFFQRAAGQAPSAFRARSRA